MARAIRAVSIERGRDVRDSLLVVFGGCGPAHAVEVARSLGIRRVLVPRAPGVFSAFGLAYADVERHLVRAHRVGVRAGKFAELQTAYDSLGEEATSELVGTGWPSDDIEILRYADLRYHGQSSELRIPVDPGGLSAGSLVKIEEAFQNEYQRTYGQNHEAERAEIVNIRVVARIRGENPTLPRLDGKGSGRPAARRAAYFGPKLEFIDTRVITRLDLVGQKLAGPMIIEEYDSTIVVPPACMASVDLAGNVLLEIEDLS
jgi:N-methylhydantoinase A